MTTPKKKKSSGSQKGNIRKKIEELSSDFLFHKGVFEKIDYVTAYDRYKKYINKEPKEKKEKILEFLILQQTGFFFNENHTEETISVILENYEKKYLTSNTIDDEELPEALYRVKRKHLKHLLEAKIPLYFKGYRYNHDIEPDFSSRPIIFSKKERSLNWVIGFDMGPYGAGVWTSIFIGLEEPEVYVELDRYMEYNWISYENLSECEEKLDKLLEILSSLSNPFFEKIKEGRRKK